MPAGAPVTGEAAAEPDGAPIGEASAEPDSAPRLPALDILRGIAILAILFANISEMGASVYAAALGNDPVRLVWSVADRIAWYGRELLLSGTARGLLEMLFGAGMVILTDRAAARGGRVLAGYAVRQLVLLLFGLAHVLLLLWPGDILHTYALAALVALCWRSAPPRLLLTVGLSLAAYQMVVGGANTVLLDRQSREATHLIQARAAGQMLTADERARLAAAYRYDADQDAAAAEARTLIAAEDRDRTGSPRSWAASAWGVFGYIEAQGLEIFFVWEAAGAMLIGAALYRWGVLAGGRSRRFYAAASLIGYGIGLPLRALALGEQFGDALAVIGPIFGEAARLLTTVGHLALVNLLLATATGRRLLQPFAAAGRTALSIYVAQTLICLWVIYPPWGLALYGGQGWAALMLTALAVNMALLAGANLWVRHFAIAPVEWAWRSLLVGRRLPFRRIG